MKRRNFSRKVRFEIIKRATNERGRLICEGCGIDVTGQKVELDHVLAEALVVDKSAALTAKDGQLLGLKCCHRGGENKTKGDIQRIRKADRQRNKFVRLGGKPSTWPCGRNSKFKKRFGTNEVVPR